MGNILLCFSLSFDNVIDRGHATFIDWWAGDVRALQSLINPGIRSQAILASFIVFSCAAISIVWPKIRPHNIRIASLGTYIRCAVGSFASMEHSSGLSQILYGLSSIQFLVSVYPIRGMMTLHHKPLVVFFFAVRQVLCTATNNEDTIGFVMGFTAADLSICLGLLWYKQSNYYLDIFIGMMEGIVLIFCAVFVHARALAVLGIFGIYVSIMSLLMKWPRDKAGLALLITIIGAATIHLGLFFQDSYSQMERLVMQSTPTLVMAVFEKSVDDSLGSQASHDTYDPILYFTHARRIEI